MEPPGTPQQQEPPTRSDSEVDVVFYTEEPKAGKNKILLLMEKNAST